MATSPVESAKLESFKGPEIENSRGFTQLLRGLFTTGSWVADVNRRVRYASRKSIRMD